MVASPELSQYMPLDRRARWAVGALVAVAVIDVAAFIADYFDYDVHDRLARGAGVTAGEVNGANDFQALVALLALAAFVVTAVFFLRWFHRAYRNLPALNGLQRYGQGWAIGSWFVPFLNLVRPKQIANDIWRGSDPESPRETPTGSERVSSLLMWWWGLFLLASLVQNFAARGFGSDTASDIRSGDEVSMGGDVLDAAAAVLAMAVIFAMTARQKARAAELEKRWSTASS